MASRRILIPPRKRIFIGCESRSEAGFTAWLRFLCDGHQLHKHLDCWPANGGDTLAVVETAIVNRTKGRRKGAYLAELVILDKDRLSIDGDRGVEAVHLAQRQRLTLIFTKPNLEGLFVRLHVGHETRDPPADHTLRELCRLWPQYQKPPNARDFLDHFSVADLKRAAKFDSDLARLLAILGLN